MKQLSRHLVFARGLLLLATAICTVLLFAVPVSAAISPVLQRQFAELESSANGRLGISVIDTGTGQRIDYRAHERFPATSTFKLLAAAAVLKQSQFQPNLLQQRIKYSEVDLVSYSPVTEKHLAKGMTLGELCAAAVQYSDNTAGNLLLKQVGGPAGLTNFARSINDTAFWLVRWETELNSAIPGDQRDTTTPAAMADNLNNLLLGDALPELQRNKLLEWLKNNTTGNASIRAGVPEGWIVADKTGGGGYGTTNDVAIVWPEEGADPLIISIYFTQHRADAKPRRDLIARATCMLITELGKHSKLKVSGQNQAE